MQFTWNLRKAASNLRKHGVSFSEAATVFADPLALLTEDAWYDLDRRVGEAPGAFHGLCRGRGGLDPDYQRPPRDVAREEKV